MIKKIAITGATSMIGLGLVKCALEQNMEVLCIVRKDSNHLQNLPKSNKLKIVFADLPEYSSLDISGNYDAFFHLAWDKTALKSRDDIDSHINNIQYTLDAVKLAKRLNCSVFIGAGSQAEYGVVSTPLKTDTPVNPQSGYGIAKYSAGKFSRLLCSQLEIRHVWVRILSVFGQNESANTLISYVINELLANRSPELTKCEQIWDYLYCEDAARGLLAIANKGIDGKTYPLGSGKNRKLSEYVKSIRDIINPKQDLQFDKKGYYPHQPMYLSADISELTADTGWEPVVSFEEGIKEKLKVISNSK